MKSSETITKISPAFLEAQKAIQSVIKEATNPFFNKKYADLTAVIGACKDQLNKQGISILQPINGMEVETILVHTSGEYFSSSTPIVCKQQNDPQALGSAITYAKRYGLQSLVLLPAEDDDGNLASGKNKTQPASQQRPATPAAANRPRCVTCGNSLTEKEAQYNLEVRLPKKLPQQCYKCSQAEYAKKNKELKEKAQAQPVKQA